MENRSFSRLSAAIETLRFPLIVFIVMLHCYTLTIAQVPGHPLYFKMVYPFALWMGETGVPAYFLISGMLLFYSGKSYGQKLKSRMRTLLVPYLFFNGIVLFGYVALSLTGRPVNILGKPMADCGILEYVRAFWDKGYWDGGNGSPVLGVFWYLRNLMVLVVLSPVLYYIIRYTRLLLPLAAGFLWVNSFHGAYTLQSLTMFCLGAYFPICGVCPITFLDKWWRWVVGGFFLMGGYDLLAHWCSSLPSVPQIHRLSLVANTLFLLRVGEWLSRRGIYSALLSRSAFFVFCIHYMIALVLTPIFYQLSVYADVIIALAYVTAVLSVTAISIFVYVVLHRLAPRFLNAITGNRS